MALEKQPGGSHYKNYPIQPVEFIYLNDVPFIEGNIIKYLLRHRDKNGIEDLHKAIHYIELLIEMEYETKGNDIRRTRELSGKTIHEKSRRTGTSKKNALRSQGRK